MDTDGIRLHFALLNDLNEKNRQRVMELLRLIRHRHGQVVLRGPASEQAPCQDCAKYVALAESDDEWPWRDYPSDDPKAGDL